MTIQEAAGLLAAVAGITEEQAEAELRQHIEQFGPVEVDLGGNVTEVS